MAASPDAGSGARGALRPGIKVPLPTGWTALVTGDGNLRAGPTGRPVLEIDREAGEAQDFPTAPALHAAFAGALKNLTVHAEDVVHGEGFLGLSLTLRGTGTDGGTRDQPLALGARRLGTDLFLCSTRPGSTTAEVTTALKSCSEIAAAPPDTP